MWAGVLRLSRSLVAACSAVTVEVKPLKNRTHLPVRRGGQERITFEDGGRSQKHPNAEEI